MTIERWRVGSIRVTRIPEQDRIPGMKALLPDATPDALAAIPWLRPHFVTPDGKMHASIHAFVVETEARCILVDTCVGNDKPRSYAGWDGMQGPFLTRLHEAGFPVERIDTVLCTHMHVDHVGWNTRWQNGRWVPTFPRARYLFGRTELAHWQAELERGTAEDGLDQAQVFLDSVQPVLDAGLALFVDAPFEVCAGVRLVPTPGHTPGHVSVELRCGDAAAFITGDIMHHPCQIARPQWAASADADPAIAMVTRRRVLEDVAASGELVLGSHFAPPTGGYVVRDGDSFRLAIESARPPPPEPESVPESRRRR